MKKRKSTVEVPAELVALLGNYSREQINTALKGLDKGGKMKAMLSIKEQVVSLCSSVGLSVADFEHYRRNEERYKTHLGW